MSDIVNMSKRKFSTSFIKFSIINAQFMVLEGLEEHYCGLTPAGGMDAAAPDVVLRSHGVGLTASPTNHVA